LWAVVGLGNPGKRYLRTRHNAGFLLVKKIAKAWEVRLRRRFYLCKGNRVTRSDGKILLAMPQTYMNRSGKAVKRILEGGETVLSNLLIVYDDLDLPLGNIRVRKDGSGGTHQGMRSVVRALESTEFPRIRVGIGPLPEDRDAADFVLSPFREEEWPLLNRSLDRACAALDLILADDIEKAMNLYN